MSRRRVRIVLTAGVSASLLAGLAVAESTSATTPDTVTESSEAMSATVAELSVATTPDSVADSSMATTGVAAADILPPDEPWGGATRGEWSARLWQREASFPADVDLVATSQGCGLGQFGPVFLLENAGVDRTCVVAEGTAIFVVVGDVDCSTVEPPPFFGRTEEELRNCAAAVANEITDSQASINGIEVADLDAYRTASPLFTLTFPENNTWGVQPGVVAQAVAESFSFIIAPPPAGNYEVFLSTMYPGSPVPVTTTINVIVEAPRVIEPPPTT